MKRVYRLQNLECANCAAKMERAIQKLNGVKDAQISFMTQKLSLDVEEELLEQILEQAQTCITKVERNCKIMRNG